jgi:hypothetical protein
MRPKKAHVPRRREVDGELQKLCRHCSTWKPLGELVKRPGCIGGRQAVCKPCYNQRWKERNATRAA